MGLALVLAAVCCDDASVQGPSGKQASSVEARASFPDRLEEHKEAVLARKTRQAEEYFCATDGKDAPNLRRTYFPSRGRCRAMVLNRVDEETDRAFVEATIEQEVYPPTGGGAVLQRWVTVHERWKRLESGWCLDNSTIFGIDLRPPEDGAKSRTP